MPKIMSLEGPQLSRLSEIRGELYSAVPRSWWRTQAQLSGIFDPITNHPIIAIGGLLVGAWLAGSATGQRLIKRRR